MQQVGKGARRAKLTALALHVEAREVSSYFSRGCILVGSPGLGSELKLASVARYRVNRQEQPRAQTQPKSTPISQRFTAQENNPGKCNACV